MQHIFKPFVLTLIFSLMLCTVGLASAPQTSVWIDFESASGTHSAPDMKATSNDVFQTTLEFQLPGMYLTTMDENGAEFQAVHAPMTGSTSEIGKPDLPVFSKFVAIPPTSDVSVELIYSDTEVFQDVTVFPTQHPVKEGEVRTDFVIDNQFYSSHNQMYPENVVRVGEPVIMRDFRLASVSIQPVQYNPVTKEMRVHHNVQVRVSYSGSNMTNAKLTERETISAAWDPIYRATVANYDDIREGRNIDTGSYLIITPNNASALPYLELFAEWKHRSGWPTRIVQLSEIGSNPSSTQIKSFIQNAYDTWEFPPEYVMLVGDEDNSSIGRMPDYPYGSYTSDHQYSTVEGADYLSDIFVGRASVDNLNELISFITKNINYQTEPNMDDGGAWFKRATMVACAGCGGPQVVTPVLTCNWVREQLLEHEYTQVDTFYDDWYGGNPSVAEISASINQGKGIVNYRGWAGPSGWYNPSFNVGNLSGLSNGEYTGIMTSIVCGTGHFGSGTDPCFGEAWIRIGTPTQPKGGVIFGGATDTNTHTKWNNPITAGFYHGLLEEGMDTFGQCWVRGKLNQYFGFPNHNQTGGTINQYHNTYNTLGDPGIHIITDSPSSFDATYDNSINYGQNSFAVTVESDGAPVEGALVVLWKQHNGEDDIFTKAYTDANGHADLMIDPLSAGTMKVTITKRNFIPHLGDVNIIQSAYSVGVDSWMVDGNGIINPGDDLQMTVTVKNFGSASVSDVVATVNSQTDWAEMDETQVTFGDLASGATANATFGFAVPDYAMSGDKVHLSFAISDDQSNNWPGIILEPVQTYHLTVMDVTSANVEPGQTGELEFRLKNVGLLPAQNVSVELTSSSSMVIVNNASSSYGTIQPGQQATNTSDPFTITVSPDVINGMQFNMMLTATDGTDYTHDFYYPIQVGQLNASAIVGPDNYGYYAYDDADPEPVGTTYNWVEIAANEGGPGTLVPGLGDDDTKQVDLPFDFQYYGQSYNRVSICSNGWFAFGETHWANFRNWQIPNGLGPDAQVSVFWDDLAVTGSERGVYTWYDSANNRFFIEWHNADTQWGGSGSNTFQVILLDPAHYLTPTGDGEIVMQFKQVVNGDTDNNYATVGIESIDQNDGVQYNYANIPSPGAMNITTGRAVRFSTSAPINAVSTIAGDVLIDGSNDPASMTRVNLWQDLNNELIFKGDAEVEADGSFMFDNVYSITGFGEYYLSVTLVDLYEPVLEWYEDSPDYNNATMIELNNGDEITDIAIHVSIPELPDVAGQATDASSSDPIANAHVTVWKSSSTGNPVYIGTVETDDNGEYTFNYGFMNHLAAGTYYASIRMEGEVQEMQWYNGANDFSEADPIDIDYDQPANGVDFALSLGAAAGISGTVTQGGSPVADMRIAAWQDNGGQPEFVDYALTHADGTYRIGGSAWNALEAGTYYLSAVLSGQGLYPTDWYDGADSFENATAVTVEAGAITTGIDLMVSTPAMGTVSGTVTFDDGSEVEDADVMVMLDETFSYGIATKTDGDGNYSVSVPPTADAIVYVGLPYYGGIVEYNQDASNPDDAARVSISADQTSTVDFSIPELEENGLLAGTITTSGGSNNFGVMEIFNVAERDRPAKTFFIGSGSTITYSKTLMAGHYTIMATGTSAEGQRTLHYYSETYNPFDATTISMNPNGYISGVDFLFDFNEMETITGTVSNANGPIDNAQVVAALVTEDGVDWINGTFADGNGDYVLRVPAGQYHVMVLGRDGVPIFYGGGVDWNWATRVVAGSSDIDFMLPITPDVLGTSISGTIYSIGSPVPNVRVYAFDDFGPAAYAITNAEGEYTLNGLQPDTRYTIEANRFGYYHGVYLTPLMLDRFEAMSNVDMELVPLDFVGIEDEDDADVVAQQFALFQNYPNPFNPSTTINFQLPQASQVTIEVYNVVGQRVKTLTDQGFSAGLHQVQWDGRNDNGAAVGSGIYYYQMKTDAGFSATKRMALLK